MKTHIILSLILLPLLFGKDSQGNRFKEPIPESERLETFVRTLTHIEVSKKALQDWQQKNPGKTSRFEQALKWMKSGEASVLNQAMMTGLVTLEKNVEHQQQITKEFIYPTEFLLPAQENEWAMPTNFLSKDLGVSWSVSSTPIEGGFTSDRLKASHSVYLGKHFENPLGHKDPDHGHFWKPIFQSTRFERELRFDNLTKAVQADAQDHLGNPILVFSEVERRKLPDIDDTSKLKRGPFTISARFVKVSEVDWKDFSKGKKLSKIMRDATLWAAAFISQKKASVLYSPSIMLKPKGYGVIENIDEVIYPTEYVPSKIPGPRTLENAPIPAAFDTTNVGLSLEYDSEIHRSGYLLLRYRFYLSSYHGDTAVHRFFDGREWVADAWMPRFSYLKQKGMVALAPGEEILVGDTAFIDDEGNPDPENRLLFFLKAE